jgi:hypothetical protein
MGAIDRLTQLSGQFAGSSGKDKILQKNPDDVRLPPSYPFPPTAGH